MRIAGQVTGRALSLAAVVFAAFGAPAMADSRFNGGELIGANYRPNIEVSYVERGPAGAGGGDLSLIRTPGGLVAMLRGPDGSGFLLRTHWRDAYGEHFTMYIHVPGRAVGPGFEAIFPDDRSKSATFFQYPAGTFKVVPVAGQDGGRPLPRPAAFYQETEFVRK